MSSYQRAMEQNRAINNKARTNTTILGRMSERLMPTDVTTGHKQNYEHQRDMSHDFEMNPVRVSKIYDGKVGSTSHVNAGYQPPAARPTTTGQQRPFRPAHENPNRQQQQQQSIRPSHAAPGNNNPQDQNWAQQQQDFALRQVPTNFDDRWSSVKGKKWTLLAVFTSLCIIVVVIILVTRPSEAPAPIVYTKEQAIHKAQTQLGNVLDEMDLKFSEIASRNSQPNGSQPTVVTPTPIPDSTVVPAPVDQVPPPSSGIIDPVPVNATTPDPVVSTPTLPTTSATTNPKSDPTSTPTPVSPRPTPTHTTPPPVPPADSGIPVDAVLFKQVPGVSGLLELLGKLKTPAQEKQGAAAGDVLEIFPSADGKSWKDQKDVAWIDDLKEFKHRRSEQWDGAPPMENAEVFVPPMSRGGPHRRRRALLQAGTSSTTEQFFDPSSSYAHAVKTRIKIWGFILDVKLVLYIDEIAVGVSSLSPGDIPKLQMLIIGELPVNFSFADILPGTTGDFGPGQPGAGVPWYKKLDHTGFLPPMFTLATKKLKMAVDINVEAGVSFTLGVASGDARSTVGQALSITSVADVAHAKQGQAKLSVFIPLRFSPIEFLKGDKAGDKFGLGKQGVDFELSTVKGTPDPNAQVQWTDFQIIIKGMFMEGAQKSFGVYGGVRLNFPWLQSQINYSGVYSVNDKTLKLDGKTDLFDVPSWRKHVTLSKMSVAMTFKGGSTQSFVPTVLTFQGTVTYNAMDFLGEHTVTGVYLKEDGNKMGLVSSGTLNIPDLNTIFCKYQCAPGDMAKIYPIPRNTKVYVALATSPMKIDLPVLKDELIRGLTFKLSSEVELPPKLRDVVRFLNIKDSVDVYGQIQVPFDNPKDAKVLVGLDNNVVDPAGEQSRFTFKSIKVGLQVMSTPPKVDVWMDAYVKVGDDVLVFAVEGAFASGIISLGGHMFNTWHQVAGIKGFDLGDVSLKASVSAGPVVLGVQLAGTVRIGEYKATVAVALSLVDKKFAVMADIQHLSVAELSKFIGNAAGRQPSMESGMMGALQKIDLQRVKMSVAPATTKIGAVTIVQGFFFLAEVQILNVFCKTSVNFVKPSGGGMPDFLLALLLEADKLFVKENPLTTAASSIINAINMAIPHELCTPQIGFVGPKCMPIPKVLMGQILDVIEKVVYRIFTIQALSLELKEFSLLSLMDPNKPNPTLLVKIDLMGQKFDGKISIGTDFLSDAKGVVFSTVEKAVTKVIMDAKDEIVALIIKANCAAFNDKCFDVFGKRLCVKPPGC